MYVCVCICIQDLRVTSDLMIIMRKYEIDDDDDHHHHSDDHADDDDNNYDTNPEDIHINYVSWMLIKKKNELNLFIFCGRR